MMSLLPFSLPPRWLPFRLLLGGMAAGVLALFFGHREGKLKTAFGELGRRCGSSLAVLILGLLLALCLAVMVGLCARRAGPRMERLIALLGRALACVPVMVLVWGFMAGWIGRLGWPVESLMPAQFSDGQDSGRLLPAHVLWEFLAPALILALSLCGEMIHSVIADGGKVPDLDFALRARGVPAASRLWHHHLRQLLPLLRVRLQSLCLVAPLHLIIIEDALQFMGWGEWMAQCFRAGESSGIALGFVSGGVMLAILCACLQVIPGAWKSSAGVVVTLAWQPWLLWALGILALLPASLMSWIILWSAVFAAGSAGWRQTWRSIVGQLPLQAACMLGAPPPLIWQTHVMHVQWRILLAWTCALSAQTLLSMAAACAVLPRLIGVLSEPVAKICRPVTIASVQDAAQTLADPAALFQSGACIALAALSLLQVSRIVQPRLY